MAAKIFVLCASVLLVQSAAGQCWGRGLAAPCGAGLGYAGYGAGYGCGFASDIAAANSLNAAYGGILGVSSASPVPTTGINVASENVYEGSLAVVGNLPFLGTVAVEGNFPTVGAGGISYRCGDSAVGITGEGIGITASTAAGLGYADLGYNGLGYGGLGYNGYGYAGHGGCGCGGLGYAY